MGWLDVLCAKARYGAWLGAELPDLLPWESVFHARGGASSSQRQQQQPKGGGKSAPVEVRQPTRWIVCGGEGAVGEGGLGGRWEGEGSEDGGREGAVGGRRRWQVKNS